MSVTQNLTLTNRDWVEVPETDCILTVDGSDELWFFWTDGATPTVGARGHKLDYTKPIQIGSGEKLFVYAQDGSGILVYTVLV